MKKVYSDKSKETTEVYNFTDNLDVFEFTVRTHNVLQAAGVRYIGELTKCTEKFLRKFKHMGDKGIDEIKEKLLLFGLSLKNEDNFKNYIREEQKRENILAEINMMKVLLWELWEESHGKIDKKDWNDLRKEMIKEMRNNKK